MNRRGADRGAPVLVCEIYGYGPLDVDLGVKIDAYREAPHIAHALWIDVARGGVLHMRRRGASVVFRHHRTGAIGLEALGIVAAVEELPPGRSERQLHERAGRR